MLYRAFQITAILALVSFIISAPANRAHSAGKFPPFERAGSLASISAVVYDQPVDPAGGILLSSKRDPDGSAADQYAWDGFRLAVTQHISEIRWRGLYDPARAGSGGKVTGFVVDIYPSMGNGFQPDISQGPLVHYQVGSNAGETLSEVIKGTQTFDYSFVLPAPFLAVAGTKYWVQIEALQAGSPDWGLAAGLNGDGVYFRRIPGQGENYQLAPGDAAFMLLNAGGNTYHSYLPVITAGG